MADDAKYVTLTSDNFEAEVLQSDLPVLVDFWAAWCGPCRIMNPIIEELAETFANKAKIAKINVDDHEAVASQYHVMAIPSLIFFNDGQLVERIEGVSTKESLVNKLNTLIQ
jgi:thioredoxin 1